VRNKDTEMVI